MRNLGSIPSASHPRVKPGFCVCQMRGLGADPAPARPGLKFRVTSHCRVSLNGSSSGSASAQKKTENGNYPGILSTRLGGKTSS